MGRRVIRRTIMSDGPRVIAERTLVKGCVLQSGDRAPEVRQQRRVRLHGIDVRRQVVEQNHMTAEVGADVDHAVFRRDHRAEESLQRSFVHGGRSKQLDFLPSRTCQVDVDRRQSVVEADRIRAQRGVSRCSTRNKRWPPRMRPDVVVETPTIDGDSHGGFTARVRAGAPPVGDERKD